MKKPKEKEITWEWVSFPPETYAAAIHDFVHFSFKTVNSNAGAGGLRVAPESGLDLPYVSARTLIEAGYVIPLDYASNSGKTAAITKQINALEAGAAAPDDPAEAQTIGAAMRQAHTTGRELNTDFVSLRLRQLLLPRDGAYVAITPLGAAGLCHIIKARVESHNEKAKAADRMRLTRAFLGIGGANPQNVGALVRDMQQPLVFFAPTLAGQLRQALGAYYRGVSLRPSRPKMLAYRRWQMAACQANGGSLQWREAEREQIEGIVAELQGRAQRAGTLLHAHREQLPNAGDPLVSPAVRGEVRGLIATELRDAQWLNRTASAIAHEIADYSFADNLGELAFEQRSIDTLAGWIAEALR